MSKTKNKREFNFKIGADPEFSIILQNKRIEANRTITEILKTKKEFKALSNGFDLGKHGNIGWDGAAQTGEIRPSAEYSPDKVIKNLREIFNKFGKYMSIFELTTLSQFASIGGHIHFEASGKENTKKQINIHTQMASFYLPILMSENKINLSLRLKQGYGTLSDFKYNELLNTPVTVEGPEGYYLTTKKVITYEFRTPSAEWLTTPKIAQATLAYLAVIYNEIINNPKNIKNFQNILLKSKLKQRA